MRESNKGTVAAITAFSLWGILPLFWKLLESVPLLQVTSHRVVWTLVILIPIIILRKSWGKMGKIYRQPRLVAIHGFAAITLAANWLLYVWATLNGHILEAALGYYINPFLYILIGRLFFADRHSPLQLAAIVLAIAGVALQFQAINGLPWIAICLACSFTAYGMMRKQSPLGSFTGLTLETSILLPVALGYLIFQQYQGHGAIGSATGISLLLIATGLATAAPLLCFATGARAISLSLLGILQFIGPTGQFLIGWLTYNEPLPPMRLASFGLIWLAVILYIVSMLRQKHKEKQATES